jgi:hypothetical protein
MVNLSFANLPSKLAPCDICILLALVAGASKEDDLRAGQSVVHAVSGVNIDTQFPDSVGEKLVVA